MSDELKDLRGRAIDWQMSRRKPLRCTLDSDGDTLGTLIQEEGAVRASFAGVWWRIAHHRGEDTVAFDDGPLIVACARQPFIGRYEAWIDRTTRYSLSADSDGKRVRWLNTRGHATVVFRRHRFSSWGETGEIVVSEASVLEHAPVLILLGLFRMSRRLVFQASSSSA